MTDEQRDACLELLKLFKVQTPDGVVTADKTVSEGQIIIFFNLVFRPKKRLQILTSTQYGKSLIVALACIIITCIQYEMVAVLAPTNEKAKIIMRYFIEHLGDSPLFVTQLEKDTKLDRLRMEESKDRIIFRSGGGIFVISVQAGNSKKGMEAAMGAGAKNCIQDESGLIPDAIESTIFRMIAGKGKDAFYCKIGNPFYRNHFLKSWRDDRYEKIFIDYKQGIKEGRYNAEFIEEARSKPFFDVLYECKFPKPEAVDADGFSTLISEEFLNQRVREVVQLFGSHRWGVDVAGEGSNYSTIIDRSTNGAKVLYKENNPDTMNFVGVILQMYKDAKEKPHKIYVDKTGIGKPVYDRLKEFPEVANKIVGVLAGESAEDDVQYFNKRAEMYWRMKLWLAAAELEGTENAWADMLDVKYKVQSDRNILCGVLT